MQKTEREERGWGKLRRRNIRATRLSLDGRTWIIKSISPVSSIVEDHREVPRSTALPCREQCPIQSRWLGFHGFLGPTSLERVILHWGWNYKDKGWLHHSTTPIPIASRMGKTKFLPYMDTQSMMIMLRYSQALSHVIVTQPTEEGSIIPDEQTTQRENNLPRVTQSGSGEAVS